MKILIANLCLCILWALLVNSLKSSSLRKRKIYSMICLFQLTIIHGSVEILSLPDLDEYYSFFKVVTKIGIDIFSKEGYPGDDMEFGYKWINWFVSFFTSNFRVLLMFVSFLIIFFYIKWFNEFSPYLWLSVLLMLLISFNGSLYILRQNLSIAIALSSYKYIIMRNRKKFFVIMFLSISCHFSSIIFLPLYYLYGIADTKRYLKVLCALTIIIPLGALTIFKIVASLIPEFNHYGDVDSMKVATKAYIFGAALLPYLYFLGKDVFELGIKKLILTISWLGLIGSACIGEAGEGRIFLSYFYVLIIQIPWTASYIKNGFCKFLFVVISLVLFYLWAFCFASEAEIIYESEFVF